MYSTFVKARSEGLAELLLNTVTVPDPVYGLKLDFFQSRSGSWTWAHSNASFLIVLICLTKLFKKQERTPTMRTYQDLGPFFKCFLIAESRIYDSFQQ